MFIRAEAATWSLGVPSAGSGILCTVPIQYLHNHSKTQPLTSGPESTTTYFGGQYLPWEPKDLARGHLCGLLPSLCLAYTLVKERLS